MRDSKRMRGLTQIELIISLTVLTVVAGGTYQILFTGVDAYGTGVSKAELERQASRVLETVTDHISMCGEATLHPRLEPPWSSPTVTFQKNLGFSEGAIVWGPPTVLELRPDSGDPEDGLDNNGNGIVDEQMLVLVESPGLPGEKTVVLSRWVREYLEGETPNGKDDNGNGLTDEPGFALSVSEGVWTIHLTLERLDRSGRNRTHTVETSVRPRN